METIELRTHHRPELGTWLAIFLAEFDGPRVRKDGVQVVPAAN